MPTGTSEDANGVAVRAMTQNRAASNTTMATAEGASNQSCSCTA